MMNIPRVQESLLQENIFSNRIIEIKNKHTKATISYKEVSFKLGNHIYSAKKESPIICFYIDNEHISKHKPYLIKYKCPTCESITEVGITQFLRKIQKESNSRCRYCVNHDEDKIMLHSEFLKKLNICTRDIKKENIEKKVYTNQEKIKMYEEEFNSTLDSEEQHDYYSYHLTKEEYAHVQKHIVSFYNGLITQEQIKNLEYIPVWKCFNQMRYTYVFHNPINDKIEKPTQIMCKCETCDSVFKIKNLHSLKNKYKVLCSYCSLCRNVFKKRSLNNINGDKVLVQSKPEIDFLNWCNKNDILIKNGPKLKYEYNNNMKTYHVDFEIPKLEWMVEIKDMHIWHKEQINNGIWDKKKEVALEKVKNKEYKRFIVIYPKNLIRMQKEILSKSKDKI
jgi:DNA-directed RNA polymerase subunit RPC12/RpoP